MKHFKPIIVVIKACHPFVSSFPPRVVVIYPAIIALVFLSSPSLSAKPQGAIVSRITGKQAFVQKKRQAAWQKLKRGDWLPIGSTIQTSKDSHVVLVFHNLEFRIGPKSRLKIKDLVKNGKSQLYLSNGAAWFHLKKKSGQKLQVRTPTTIAAVRGTKFSLIEGKTRSYTCVCEGEIEAKSKNGKTSSVKTGQSLHLSHGKAKIEDYSKYFKKRSVAPAFLKRQEAPAMQYCLSCHRVQKPGNEEEDEFEDY